MGRVVYLGSFSKMLVPNIRVGFLAGPPDLVEALTQQKLLSSLSSPEIDERIVYRALTEGSYRKHCLRTQAALGALFSQSHTPNQQLRINIATSADPGMLAWLRQTLEKLH